MATIWREERRTALNQPPPTVTEPATLAPARGPVWFSRLRAALRACFTAPPPPAPRSIPMSLLCPRCLDDTRCPACEQDYLRRVSRPLPIHLLAATMLETLGYPEFRDRPHAAHVLAARAGVPLDQAKQALGWLVEHEFIRCHSADGLTQFAE